MTFEWHHAKNNFFFIITTKFEYADIDRRVPVQSNFCDWKAARRIYQYNTYTSARIYMYQITCSVATGVLQCL